MWKFLDYERKSLRRRCREKVTLPVIKGFHERSIGQIRSEFHGFGSATLTLIEERLSHLELLKASNPFST